MYLNLNVLPVNNIYKIQVGVITHPSYCDGEILLTQASDEDPKVMYVDLRLVDPRGLPKRDLY